MFPIDDVRASFDEPTFRRGFAYAANRPSRAARRSDRVAIQSAGAGNGLRSLCGNGGNGQNRRDPAIYDLLRLSDVSQCKHGAAAAIAFARRAEPDGAQPEVAEWLRQLDAFSMSADAEPSTESIRYLLDVTRDATTLKLRASVVSSRKTGERSIGRAIDLTGLNFGERRYVTPVDQTIGGLAVASCIVNQYAYAARVPTSRRDSWPCCWAKWRQRDACTGFLRKHPR